jgi:hypothetical protein
VTRFSARYAVPLGILLAGTLAGVLYGHAVPVRDECGSHATLLVADAFSPPIALRTEGSRSTKIAGGRLTGVWPGTEDRPDVGVGIVRSLGLPNLLLEPAMALPGRNEPDDVRAASLQTPSGPVPIHYAYERRGRQVRITAYLMTYRGDAIEDPISTRLREAPRAMLHGTSPITLFATAVRTHVSREREGVAALDAWLRDAWEHYRQVCR